MPFIVKNINGGDAAMEVENLFNMIDRDERRKIRWQDFTNAMVDVTLNQNLVHQEQVIEDYKYEGHGGGTAVV